MKPTELELILLVNNESDCPFSNRTVFFLEKTPKGKELIGKVLELYKIIDFHFFSAGNSPIRNIISELNRPYRYADTGDTWSLYAHSLKNKDLMKMYELYFIELRELGKNFKYRRFNDIDKEIMEILYASDKHILTSNMLTEEGMLLTINTYQDFPQEIRGKITCRSTDL